MYYSILIFVDINYEHRREFTSQGFTQRRGHIEVKVILTLIIPLSVLTLIIPLSVLTLVIVIINYIPNLKFTIFENINGASQFVVNT